MHQSVYMPHESSRLRASIGATLAAVGVKHGCDCPASPMATANRLTCKTSIVQPPSAQPHQTLTQDHIVIAPTDRPCQSQALHPIPRTVDAPRPLRIGTDCSGMGAPIFAIRNLRIPYARIVASDIDARARRLIRANHNPQLITNGVRTRGADTTPSVDIYIAASRANPTVVWAQSEATATNKGEAKSYHTSSTTYALRHPRPSSSKMSPASSPHNTAPHTDTSCNNYTPHNTTTSTKYNSTRETTAFPKTAPVGTW